MRWFRKSTGDPLAVTMSGVKLGDRLLVVGCADARLIAALAAKAGLTGRACAVDADAARSTAAAADVEREGALVETFTAPWIALPFGPESFDVVVVRGVLPRLDSPSRVEAIRDVHRVLRGGGRCVVIDDAPGGLVAAALRRNSSADADPDYASTGGATRALDATGFRAVRALAEREGLRFAEGIKAVSGAVNPGRG